MIDYTDPDTIARQNIAPNAGCNIDGKFYDVRNLVHLASLQADRIEALEAKLAAIDDLMVRRIKHHQEMKDLKGSGTAQKREHHKLHALSEALGEIRKVTKGESHD